MTAAPSEAALAKAQALRDEECPHYPGPGWIPQLDCQTCVAAALDEMMTSRDVIDTDRRLCERRYAEVMRERDESGRARDNLRFVADALERKLARAVEALREIATSHSVMEPPHARADRALREIEAAS